MENEKFATNKNLTKSYIKQPKSQLKSPLEIHEINETAAKFDLKNSLNDHGQLFSLARRIKKKI